MFDYLKFIFSVQLYKVNTIQDILYNSVSLEQFIKYRNDHLSTRFYQFANSKILSKKKTVEPIDEILKNYMDVS